MEKNLKKTNIFCPKCGQELNKITTNIGEAYVCQKIEIQCVFRGVLRYYGVPEDCK